MHIYINRIYDSLVFKIKDRYKLELQTPETMIIYKNKKLWKPLGSRSDWSSFSAMQFSR